MELAQENLRLAKERYRIDAERKLIRVRGGKGRKDRYTLYSDLAGEMIVAYIK